MLRNRVKKCEDNGQVCVLMADFNAAANDSARPFDTQANRIIEWEESGEVRLLNDKQATTHIPREKHKTA